MNGPLLLDMTRCVARRLKGQTPSGIDRVADAYAARFADEALAVMQLRGRMLVLNKAASRSLFSALDIPTNRFRLSLAALFAKLPWSIAKRDETRGGVYLNVSHTDFDLDAHWRAIERRRLKPIYLLHDLIPITHPHVTTPHKTARHLGRVLRTLSHADGVIANSRATADELRKFAADQGLEVPSLLVAPIAGAGLPKHTGAREPKGSTFVSIGTIETRKNHALLLDVWTRLIEKLGADTPRLILAGNWGRGAGRVRAAMRRDPRLQRFVEIRTGLGDAEIARCVGQSRAALMPTLAEGYGLPMVEALQMQTPVIASDLPSLREVGQGIPTLLDPIEIAAWVTAILDFCNQGAEWQRQLAAINAFCAPTWAEHFAALDNWLASLSDTDEGTASCANDDIHLYKAPAEQERRSRQTQC